MARFNTNVSMPMGTGTGPIVTSTVSTTVTAEGGAGYKRDAKSELFLLAVTNMVGTDTFYESAQKRDSRFAALVHQVALADPAWMMNFIYWLRTGGNMRTASLVAAAESAHIHVDNGVRGSRAIINAACQRPDEPGELLAYWVGKYGKNLPKPVKRGIADAVVRLYDQRSYLKWDSSARAFRFADVIELVHPKPGSPMQGELFKHIINARHGRDAKMHASLDVLWMNRDIRAHGTDEQWLMPRNLRAAGMTWEDVLSAKGSTIPKKDLWEAMIPNMGYMALLRNLRNFDEAGVSDEMATKVCNILSNPDMVEKSRQFPLRFLSAYKSAPSFRWNVALEMALQHSLSNIPPLPGRTLILTDCSGSMSYGMSDRSKVSRAEAASIFAGSLALRAEAADLYAYGTSYRRITFTPATPLLRLVQNADMGGTNTFQTLAATFQNHYRVIIITDEQAFSTGRDWYGISKTPVLPNVPIYTWNMAGYEVGHLPGNDKHWTFGGLTDAGFQMIPTVEAHGTGRFPWESQ